MLINADVHVYTEPLSKLLVMMWVQCIVHKMIKRKWMKLARGPIYHNSNKPCYPLHMLGVMYAQDSRFH